MTRHVGEDTLIQLALGLLEAGADQRVRRHLEGCRDCRVKSDEVDRTLRTIKDVTPHVRAGLPALFSPGHARYRWLRVAAMLAMSFGLGFLASETLQSPSVNVVEQRMIPRPPERSVVGFVACDVIDLSWSPPGRSF